MGSEDDNICEDEKYEVVYEIEGGKIDMGNQPFFSIVMPVYNVSKYLKQAVESVCLQTFKDYELILIDDCSVDGSAEICDQIAIDTDKIQVMHLKNNKGVSNARNVGMSIASGQYLMFMDSDDFIDSELLERVYISIQENTAQIVFFGMTEEHYNKKGECIEKVIYSLPEKRFKEKQLLREYMIEVEKSTLYGYACNKVYDLKYLRSLELKYVEYELNEDILFNIAFCRDITKMNIINFPAYHYRKVMNDASRTAKFVKDYFILHVKKIRALYEQYEYWGLCDAKIRGELATIYTRYIISAIQRNCDPRSKMSFISRKKWLEELYEQSLYLELIPYGKPKNKIVKFLHSCLKHHFTFATMILGRVIYIIKNELPIFFNAIQKNR